MNNSSGHSTLLKVSVAATLLFSLISVYAEDLDKIIEVGIGRTEDGQASQAKIDKLSEATEDLLSQYNKENKIVDGLKIYNDLLQKQIDDQSRLIKELNHSIDEVALIERHIVPLMVRMLESLDQFIKLDIPFLLNERIERVTRLKAMMERSDVTVTEKFRRILEAFQIEIDYGKTIKAYRGTLEINETVRDVEFLRVGRVAYLYQTINAQQTGVWDKKNKSWIELPSAKYRIPVTKAIRIAKQQIAPDLLILPIDSAETL